MPRISPMTSRVPATALYQRSSGYSLGMWQSWHVARTPVRVRAMDAVPVFLGDPLHRVARRSAEFVGARDVDHHLGADDRDGAEYDAQGDERQDRPAGTRAAQPPPRTRQQPRLVACSVRLWNSGHRASGLRRRRWRNVDHGHGRLEGRVAQRELALAREVDRLAQDARSLLRRVEARGVFRLDEVQVELRAPLQVTGREQVRILAPRAFAAFRSSISATTAAIALSRSAQCRSWICSTRAWRSSAVTLSSCFLWQVTQAAWMFSSGLRTQ